MTDEHADGRAGDPGDAFAFTGTWRDYLPIALSNLLLTIVTIGVYRFWAKARERRYLWSHTRFIDDRLEWTGTGREMFIGFLIAIALFTPPLLFLRFGTQAMVLRGYGGAAGLLTMLLYGFLTFAFGFARFRALRYRFSRSYWHGIRGGSDEPGFRYAWSATWKTILGWLALALLVPWAMARLWNERWGAMSFGPYRFRANVHAGPLMLRWIVLLVSPILIVIVSTVVAVGLIAVAADWVAGLPGSLQRADGNTLASVVMFGIAAIVAVYFLIGMIGLFYYAAFQRAAIGSLSLGDLEFRFTARSKDWLLLFLGDILLVVGTVGLGICFLGYRHWSFLIRHLGAAGQIDLSQVTQSATRAPREAEGFADAFDLGAI